MLRDGKSPACAASVRLVLPFQKTGNEHGQAAFKFSLFAFAHILDFLGDVLDIQGGEMAGSR